MRIVEKRRTRGFLDTGRCDIVPSVTNGRELATATGGLPPSARLAGIGFYVGLSIALFTIGGVQLDKLLDTGKLFTVVGLLTGLVVALYGAYQQLMEVLAAIDRRRKAGK